MKRIVRSVASVLAVVIAAAMLLHSDPRPIVPLAGEVESTETATTTRAATTPAVEPEKDSETAELTRAPAAAERASTSLS
ncbi:MAG: hypothetical protein U1F36_01260 [Planctomycetota bacterium]